MSTLKEQIKEVAKHANLTPRAADLLGRFFLKVTTDEESQELDDWMHESPANDQLFDLMLEFNKDGTGAAYLRLLNKVTKKPKVKRRFGVGSWILFILLGSFGIFWIETFIPSRPLSTLFMGSMETSFIDLTAETGDTTKTVWLFDSTRIELLPHSKLEYPNDFPKKPRRVRLTGSAKFYVHKEKKPLWVGTISGNLGLEIHEGVVTLLAEGGNITVQDKQQ
ncbi:FecR domain-containing protein [Flavihumibacter solisilvae]|uniref:Uncharacterized protein n=1 Tax=Flavihumibacter solisilvae TaxID=1349421 RepID=A0A0C1ILL9_9BACT|nr:FecR domain-containing protein [Flavihumibacter solisilvae]KIC91319.1 hypothetical protein OI18_22385 [Flavihumibacter solisilvae]